MINSANGRDTDSAVVDLENVQTNLENGEKRRHSEKSYKTLSNVK